MLNTVVSYPVARSLHLESALKSFLTRARIMLGRGKTAQQLIDDLRQADPEYVQQAYGEYGYSVDLLFADLNLPSLKKLLPEVLDLPSPFAGLEIGVPVGKPAYVSGKNAYAQKYSSGIILCFSYKTVIGCQVNGQKYYTTAHYSTTTERHIVRFGLRDGLPVTSKQLEALERS